MPALAYRLADSVTRTYDHDAHEAAAFAADYAQQQQDTGARALWQQVAEILAARLDNLLSRIH